MVETVICHCVFSASVVVFPSILSISTRWNHHTGRFVTRIRKFLFDCAGRFFRCALVIHVCARVINTQPILAFLDYLFSFCPALRNLSSHSAFFRPPSALAGVASGIYIHDLFKARALRSSYLRETFIPYLFFLITVPACTAVSSLAVVACEVAGVGPVKVVGACLAANLAMITIAGYWACH